jgi:hypothetical protein
MGNLMFENKRIVPAVNDQTKTPDNTSNAAFWEIRGRMSVIAFFLGMAIIAASIFLGRSYVFFVSFLVFSFFITFLWRKKPRPWIYLASITAATPIAIARQQFACNLIFAFWFAAFNIRYWFRLPKWIYVPAILALLGIFTSSINWISSDVLRSFMRQGALAFNFFLAPFLLLPMVYLRMRESRDHGENLKGLLFCLIIPSTLILLSAKLFGTVANAWEASLHVGSLPEGFLQYQLGKVLVSFLRTEVGFIFAALICASAAIAFSQIKGLYRLIAGACLVSNVFLLLATASFGSIFACFCGLAAIFYTQSRTVSITKVLVAIAAICCMLLLIYSLSPPSMKKYLDKRYEHRVVKADTDRFALWARGVDQILQHPEGVGMTLSVGDKNKTYMHNDYLVYTASYGFIGGLAYVILMVGLLFSFIFLRKSTINDPAALAVHLAGLSVVVVLAVNGITDHSNENRWYFNVIWSLIWYCYFCSRATHVEPVRKKANQSAAVLSRQQVS